MKSLPLLRTSLSLRKVKLQLPRLRGKSVPVIDLKALSRKLLGMANEVTAAQASAAEPILYGYVDTHVGEWLADARAHHDKVATQLDLIATRVVEAEALYLAHHEDQENVLHDLEGAVSHALDRVASPDVPFFDPEPRSKRRGRKS
ncbi:hypothetical protein ABZ345_08665 [Lentzea sp. NPDC005914]|uniref:hypothetical protein n=1 Tax=Lentzea sp. NPDC005914 TaxID=3154572 RepID=UPI0033E799FD